MLLFRLVFCLFGCFATPKLPVSILKRNNRNKRLVSDSAETSFGSSFSCFNTKLVSEDTLIRTMFSSLPRFYISPSEPRCVMWTLLQSRTVRQGSVIAHQKFTAVCEGSVVFHETLLKSTRTLLELIKSLF
jgi:hypothetical protein